MGPKKKTEAQLARAKAKDKKKRDTLRAQIKQDHETLGGAAGVEKQRECAAVAARLQELGLATVAVPTDGDCLFASLLHQLRAHGVAAAAGAPAQAAKPATAEAASAATAAPTTTASSPATASAASLAALIDSPLAMRRALAEFIVSRAAEYGNFITAADIVEEEADAKAGGGGSKRKRAAEAAAAAAAAATAAAATAADPNAQMAERVARYAASLAKDSNQWGSHVELAAAASMFGTSIRVVTATHTEVVTPCAAPGNAATPAAPLWTVVHWQHKFTLGAHYEPTRPRTAADDEKAAAGGDSDSGSEGED